jgi:hypothetical protein
MPVTQRLSVRRDGVLSHRNVELAVRSKVNRAAVVISGTQIIQVNNHHLAPGFRDVGVSHTRGETADAIVDRCCRNRVINIDKPVGGKIWIECDSQKSTLTRSGGGNRGKRSRQESSIADNAQCSALLADKEPAVGGKGHRRGVRRACQLDFCETRRKGCGLQ